VIGAVWGIGQTVTILIVGGAIILFGVVIPPPGRPDTAAKSRVFARA